MPVYDEPEDPHFIRLEARFGWVPAVLEIEYGEREVEEEVPDALNWLNLLPEDPRYDLDEVECALAYENPATGYVCTLWDASGENDLPWATLLVDDYGVRLLPEYSVLDEDADEATLETVLARSSDELPNRLLSGEFDRTSEPLVIPEWLRRIADEDEA